MTGAPEPRFLNGSRCEEFPLPFAENLLEQFHIAVEVLVNLVRGENRGKSLGELRRVRQNINRDQARAVARE